MPRIRAPTRLNRNIHFLNGENEEIGGTWQNGLLTWAEMTEWFEIVYEIPLEEYSPHICLENGDPTDPVGQHGPPIVIQSNPDRIQPGYYVLLSHNGSIIDIPINPENPIPRTLSLSHSTDPRCSSFRNRVRERDNKCVISRWEVADPSFTGFQAAHIFPLAHIDLWNEGSWKNQLSDDRYVGLTGIHSIQNGILLRNDLHAHFGKYNFSINPDQDYKVYFFIRIPDLEGVRMFQNPDTPHKYQPCKALLKYHFRMAVLANMKARAGYLDWDQDMPEGCDQIAEISNSEDGQLRFETELATRLNGIFA